MSDDPRVVYTKLKRVREAIVQAWRVGTLLRDGSVTVGGCASKPRDFLLIVASRQLLCCTGEHLKGILGENVFDDLDPSSEHGKPTLDQLARLPPQNIVIASIEEFEHLMGCVGAGEVDLAELLMEVGESARDPSRSVMFLDQFLERKTKGWRTPALQARFRDRVEKALLSALD